MYQLPGFEKDFIYASINDGVDFERALEVLNILAGQAFRDWRQAKASSQPNPAQIADLLEAYRSAQKRVEDLRPIDRESIAAILSERR